VNALQLQETKSRVLGNPLGGDSRGLRRDHDLNPSDGFSVGNLLVQVVVRMRRVPRGRGQSHQAQGKKRLLIHVQKLSAS
jgi:hypothetical protein